MPNRYDRLARFVADELHDKDMDAVQFCTALRDEYQRMSDECAQHPGDFSTPDLRYWDVQSAEINRMFEAPAKARAAAITAAA